MSWSWVELGKMELEKISASADPSISTRRKL